MIEGAVRKWILPEYSNEVFAVKDVVLFLAFATYVTRRPQRMPKGPSLMVWVFWALIAISYAAIGGFTLENLIGLRYYLAPLPLLVIIPELIRTPEDLTQIAKWTVRIALPIGVLATVQYFSPPDSRINSYAWSVDEAGATFGLGDALQPDRARVTGTFSYISTYASFLTAAWVLAWLCLLHSKSRFDRWLSAIGLVLTSFNMGMNGSRLLLLTAVATGLPFSIALVRQLGSIRTQALALAVIFGVGYIGTSIFEPFALTAERGDMAEALERISGALLTPYTTLSEADLVGSGIGYTFGGLEQLGFRTSTPFDEINLDRIGVEVGVFGYAYLLFLKLFMLWKTVRAYMVVNSTHIRHWLMAALLIQLNSMWQIPFYNSVAAIFYFSAIGLVYWVEAQFGAVKRAVPPGLFQGTEPAWSSRR
jgi:hypothetical protein